MVKNEDIEKIKKEINKLNIKDLAEIIRSEPLIAGKNSIIAYSKKQREELKDKLIEITNLVLDLGELECKFLKENHKRKNEIDIDLEILEELFGL